MAEQTIVAELLSNELDTIESTETVRSAQRRMESQTLRSLIVTAEDRPVGVLKWRDIRGENGEGVVSSYMESTFPVLRADMSVPDAHAHVGDVDIDNIPVVDEDGRLVGELPRGALRRLEQTVEPHDHHIAANDPLVAVAGEPTLDLRVDMDVHDAEDQKLGKLKEIANDPSTHRMTHITVEHGLLRKKHKRIPADTITAIHADNVVLGITKMEWGFLADIEDQDT